MCGGFSHSLLFLYRISQAFLKHGSPVVDKPRRTFSGDKSDSGSMPSLTSSEESPTSTGGGGKNEYNISRNSVTNMPPPTTAERAAVNQLASSEKTAVNALLMAAMAMTEMSGGNDDDGRIRGADSIPFGPSEGNNGSKEEDGAATPPSSNTHAGKGSEGTPKANISADENFETPQKNLLGRFMSPKRKASEASPMETRTFHATPMSEEPSARQGQQQCYDAVIKEEDEEDDEDIDDGDDDDHDESPKREHPDDGTPCTEQKVKRSRFGSLKKGSRLMAQQLSNGGGAPIVSERKASNAGVAPMEITTPAKGRDGSVADLTPVSARCIDFKKMRVNDSSTDPAVADPATASTSE
jgi:hypothetical protein